MPSPKEMTVAYELFNIIRLKGACHRREKIATVAGAAGDRGRDGPPRSHHEQDGAERGRDWVANPGPAGVQMARNDQAMLRFQSLSGKPWDRIHSRNSDSMPSKP